MRPRPRLRPRPRPRPPPPPPPPRPPPPLLPPPPPPPLLLLLLLLPLLLFPRCRATDGARRSSLLATDDGCRLSLVGHALKLRIHFLHYKVLPCLYPRGGNRSLQHQKPDLSMGSRRYDRGSSLWSHFTWACKSTSVVKKQQFSTVMSTKECNFQQSSLTSPSIFNSYPSHGSFRDPLSCVFLLLFFSRFCDETFIIPCNFK